MHLKGCSIQPDVVWRHTMHAQLQVGIQIKVTPDEDCACFLTTHQEAPDVECIATNDAELLEATSCLCACVVVTYQEAPDEVCVDLPVFTCCIMRCLTNILLAVLLCKHVA